MVRHPTPPHERHRRGPEFEPTHGEIMDKLEELEAFIRELVERR